MIIGVSGKKCTGKDTVGKYITEKHSQYKTTWFATILKEIVERLYPLNFSNMSAEEKEKHRPKLQFIGDTLRNFDPLIWVNALLRQYPDNIVICDVRYPNEIDEIHRRGGLVIRLLRDTGFQDNHNSEIALDNFEGFDVVFDNNGSYEDLYKQVNSWLRDKKIV